MKFSYEKHSHFTASKTAIGQELSLGIVCLAPDSLFSQDDLRI